MTLIFLNILCIAFTLEINVIEKTKLNPQHIGLQLLPEEEKTNLTALLIVHCETPELLFFNNEYLQKQIDLGKSYLILLREGADKVIITEDGINKHTQEFGFKLKRGEVYEISLEVTNALSFVDNQYEHFEQAIEQLPTEYDNKGYVLNLAYLKTGDDTALINFKVFPDSMTLMVNGFSLENGMHQIYVDSETQNSIQVRPDSFDEEDYWDEYPLNEFREEKEYLSFSSDGNVITLGSICDSYIRNYGQDIKKIPVKMIIDGEVKMVDLYRRQCVGLREGEYSLSKSNIISQSWDNNSVYIHNNRIPDTSVVLSAGNHKSPKKRTDKCELVSLIITENNRTQPKVVCRSSYGDLNDLERKAIEIVKKWEFKPAKKSDKEVSYRVFIPVNFGKDE